MTTPTRFQTVNTAGSQLTAIFSIIQQDASEPTSGLYTDPVVRDC